MVLPSDPADRGEGAENSRKPKPKSPDPAEPGPTAVPPANPPETAAPAPSASGTAGTGPAGAEATNGPSSSAPHAVRTGPAIPPAAAPAPPVRVAGAQSARTVQGMDLPKFMQLWGGMGLTVLGAAGIWQFLRMRRNGS